jgi:hypothetical protein
MRSGDVQEDQLIRSLLLIAPGKLYRIALPLQVHELDALDHRGDAVHDLDVQTGDYLGIIGHGSEKHSRE